MSLSKAMIELGMALTLFPLRVSQRSLSTAQSILDRYAKELDEGALSDAQYAKHRLTHPVFRILKESPTEILIETVEGRRERWAKPSWRLVERLG